MFSTRIETVIHPKRILAFYVTLKHEAWNSTHRDMKFIWNFPKEAHCHRLENSFLKISEGALTGGTTDDRYSNPSTSRYDPPI